MKKTFDNQNQQYPVVLIPKMIYENLSKGIPDKTIAAYLNIKEPELKRTNKPSMPSKTISKEITKYKLGCNFYVLAIWFLFWGIVVGISEKSLSAGILYSLGFGFAAVLLLRIIGDMEIIEKTKGTEFVMIDEGLYQKLKIEYDKKNAQFEADCINYEKNFSNELGRYNELISQNKVTVCKAIHNQCLIPTIKASRGKPSNKRGIAELMFLEKMSSELEGLIHVDMVINTGKGGYNTYNPDFTLICPKTNLHIDIEIDEPYTLSDKSPIHYIGSSDEERNDFFLENNWCVIRFSEEQVIKNAIDCISTIKSIYHSIINLKNRYEYNIIPEPRWTYEKTLILGNKRYREEYLNQRDDITQSWYEEEEV